MYKTSYKKSSEKRRIKKIFLGGVGNKEGTQKSRSCGTAQQGEQRLKGINRCRRYFRNQREQN